MTRPQRERERERENWPPISHHGWLVQQRSRALDLVWERHNDRLLLHDIPSGCGQIRQLRSTESVSTVGGSWRFTITAIWGWLGLVLRGEGNHNIDHNNKRDDIRLWSPIIYLEQASMLSSPFFML
ncbi:hypothetical protein BO99DRAFT_50829 [Aspergillus violaceofuscus CBS 115571]|uniref:Uncharacterized protein n=1 Tax=Aspergillus violaceofuscus (strain CBS 115571) TaxID=1450538 RepID=A0A2V5GR01_ASPV1|nr:hypothetical protein BO99DRAFT_50829 [Aspergillus violaceofuscus CBS 115571]